MNIDECCPEFDPKKWEGSTHHWDQKPFIKESVPTFFHIPFPPMIGKKIHKMSDLAEKSNAIDPVKSNVLVLFHDPSPFKSEIFLSVTDSVSEAANVRISGNFISKVYDGPYNAIPTYIKDMGSYLEANHQKAKDYFIHYAYCPKCAKKFGHNYMILFAEV